MTWIGVGISLAASCVWKLWQLDVKNAFLYGEIVKEIYKEQLKGYVSHDHAHE